jgi:hypothetical protein
MSNLAENQQAYWTPWFNGGYWVHYGVPGTPSESVFMPVWHEDVTFNYGEETRL